MYIHVVEATAIPFSVYYYDILWDINRPSNNVNDDAALIRSYINVLLHRKLDKKCDFSLQICLLGMFLNAKKNLANCGMYDRLLNNTETGILFAPCGSIYIRSLKEIPVLYTWIIKVWNNFKINTTIVQIDIPYETLTCSYNYLCMYDQSTSNTQEIFRLCGRAFGKIFFSISSLVHITLALNSPGKLPFYRNRIARKFLIPQCIAMMSPDEHTKSPKKSEVGKYG